MQGRGHSLHFENLEILRVRWGGIWNSLPRHKHPFNSHYHPKFERVHFLNSPSSIAVAQSGTQATTRGVKPEGHLLGRGRS
jgi:hypothetical protein